VNGVEVAGIRKSFGATRVLDDVAMRFAEGRFTSLLGPSGSGKTTLLRIIGGFEPPDAGTVTIGGADVTRTPLWQRRIGMVFQSYALFPHMTVADNVAYGLHRQGIRGAAARAEVARALALVELEGFDARRPKQLSGGQQQRVALARAIVTKPRVLLLDEPLSALDRRLRQTMQVELRRIQRDSGLTTIFVTHDQEEALTLSDRIAILDGGRIVQEGPPAEVYERPATRFAATFLGDANLFEGPVRGEAVATASGPLRSADPLPGEGTPVTLAVRPEKILPLAPGRPIPAGYNSLDATLRQTVYAGATSTFLLETRAGAAVKCFCQSREAPALEPAAAVRLAWSPDHTVLLRS
jgi:putative spermidine/putrescine transport system ATP-binding protein/spermidine/putrescine transport system ATP-binding protein